MLSDIIKVTLIIADALVLATTDSNIVRITGVIGIAFLSISMIGLS